MSVVVDYLHPQGAESVLSLSLVKRFMELHGGQVVVDSEVGKGTATGCVFGPVELACSAFGIWHYTKFYGLRGGHCRSHFS